jgi:ribonuclease P protein component
MLAKKNRLTKNNDFDAVFKKGKSCYRTCFGIKILKKDDSIINRFGILLSTKVSKKAVLRNLYKRRIRVILREENQKLKEGYDCAVVVFPLILGKNKKEIKSEIQIAFKKLKLYNEI